MKDCLNIMSYEVFIEVLIKCLRRACGLEILGLIG